MGSNKKQTADCPFCYKPVSKSDTQCPNCGTAFKIKNVPNNYCGEHACASGDQARKTEGDYVGGYVD